MEEGGATDLSREDIMTTTGLSCSMEPPVGSSLNLHKHLPKITGPPNCVTSSEGSRILDANGTHSSAQKVNEISLESHNILCPIPGKWRQVDERE